MTFERTGKSATIASIAGELVRSGWPRQDPDPDGNYTARASQSWWCMWIGEGRIECQMPRQFLTLHSQEGWNCTVAADIDGEVFDFTVWVERLDHAHHLCLLTGSHWPGLRPMLAIAQAMFQTMSPESTNPAS